MAKLSMNETTTFRWTFEEDVVAYAEAGIPAIGVWRQKLSDLRLDRAVALLEEHGLEVSHLLWAGGFTGSEGRSFRASLNDAQEALETAHALGADSLVVYSGARAGHTVGHAWQLMVQALKELAPRAVELDVALAVEPMHPGCGKDFTFLEAIDDVVALINQVGSPAVKMVFDTYHLGQDEDCLKRIADVVPHVALVQLGDAKRPPTVEQNRCLLGHGTIPLDEIVGALSAEGYDGYYDVELLGEDVEYTDYHQLLDHAKRAFDSLLGSAWPA